jgi:trimeric autotransporter adhesin
MSTKTTFKRVALVAVAALGLGVLSVAPSSAVVSNLAITVSNGTATQFNADGASARVNADSTTAADITVSALLDATSDTVSVTIIRQTRPALATIDAKIMFVETTTPLAPLTWVSKVAGNTAAVAKYDSIAAGSAYIINTDSQTAGVYGAKFKVQLDTNTAGAAAGTYTYSVLVKTYTAGVLVTTDSSKSVSIVVSPWANAGATPSAGLSAAFLGNSTNTTASADDAGVTGVATAGTLVANLNVRLRNALDAQGAVDTITITVTGPGLIDTTSDTKFLRVVGQTGDVNYPIIADGTAGRTTITVAYEVTKETYTKTLTFYAVNAATITTSVRTPTLRVGTNDGAVGVTAADANGNAWTGTAYIVASSAADALIAGSTTPQACSYTVTTGIRCNVAGTTAGTAKFKVIDASTVANAKATSAEFSLTVSAATAARVVVEFDKQSYAPFEKATIMVSAVDAAGNLVPANTFNNLFAAGGISASQAFSGSSDTLTAVAITTANATSAASGTVALKRVYTVYMPAQGDVVLSWTGGTSLPAAGQVAGTLTASIVNSSVDAATDAANEATDAANAATDAALAAADAADAATAAAQDASDAVAALSASVSKLISSLRAQITSLTNLVIKIQKKVRA